MQGIAGILVLILVAWVFSENRAAIRWRLIATGVLVQFVLAGLLLKVPLISERLLLLNSVVHAIEAATRAGASFIFGYLSGGEIPFAVTVEDAMYLFAFRVLPQILVFSVLVALFWYWKILPWFVRWLGTALRRTLGIGGAVGIAAASSVFLGMVETPLVVRAYLARMSRSELFTVMTCGMSTVAGSIMVLYASVLTDVIDGALGHILIASVINVVGAVFISRTMVPGTSDDLEGDLGDPLGYTSNMDAVTRGTMDGLRLAVNVGAMVLVLVSLVALVNHVISGIDVADAPLTLERMMGWVFAPVAWLIGVPWQEAQTVGSLLGSKLVLNELVAYLQLANLDPVALGSDSRLIVTYALCGFANFGSLGIMLAGLSTLIPERREEFLHLGPRTLISGTLVTCITGAIVGLLANF
ncbi:MAG: nucleoside transporter C-terminal domain-containing protein [Pseudomonadales bacterium]|jgi:CNT family concentrative nucleoside transporter|nr:nucleoside transporter C-terminal domain-containing protein [Pseudomonadales bacterium]MDP6472994.1 nucleoside transporter C-terminal domain-containing protein [Pseudomonadales bacterium]MDP6826249.1 nucleoside transporter C-terminal domain-containing protein [Pseudomonadales bacterium]MDP6970821.1 nucleoside transporter C-terminal domain-containing protein [Pseudomonadales bacterium]|tara:strand:- start:115 stop:1353 length:1239 start_codon:yes stop_codon:yes gene_type:complete